MPKPFSTAGLRAAWTSTSTPADSLHSNVLLEVQSALRSCQKASHSTSALNSKSHGGPRHVASNNLREIGESRAKTPFSILNSQFSIRNPFSILLLCLVLSSCASTRFSARRDIETVTFIEFIQSERAYDKALADPVSRTVYALTRADQQIHVYRDGKRINSFGGLGTQSYNFQRLTDIALDNDGSLLALDMMAKELRRFSPDGKLLARLDLSALSQPELLVMSPDRDLLIYDAAPQELVCISMLDASELYRFGKFQLRAPSSLNCNRDQVSVYSKTADETQFYYILGQFKESRKGQWLQDAFGNSVLAEYPRFGAPDNAAAMPLIADAGLAAIYRESIAVVYPGGIGIYQIVHRRPQR